MRYFVDAEFNGFGGELISLAAVPEDDDASPFYEAIECAKPTEWVTQNVLPVLQTKTRTPTEVASLFCEFLDGDHSPVIISDWPEDIVHAASLLTNGNGRRLLQGEVEFRLLNHSEFSADRSSKVPHNAYYDALALRDWFVERQ